MKKTLLYSVAALLFGLTAVSCSEDILDQDPKDSFTDAAVWEDLSLAKSALNYCYTFMEAEHEQGVMFCNYTDETFHMHGYGTDNYTQGRVSPDNYNCGWTDAKGLAWEHYFAGIKQCNQLLEKIEDTPTPNDGDDEVKQQIIGQAYFLRAFYYHYLYGLYGRVPLIDHTYGLDSEFTETRQDMDAVADFIIADCDRAISMLPEQYPDKEFGRATKGAAMALKARVLLWQASPLFGTPSTEKWKKASDANKAVIDLGIYSLQPVADSDEYADLFNDDYNPEAIFMKRFDKKGLAGSSASAYMSTPAGPGNGFEGWSTWQPTYEIVNLFQNADGTDFVEAPTKKFNVSVWVDDEHVTEIDGWDQGPWEGRDMRLYADIFYDGCRWGYGTDNREVEIFEAGEDGVNPGLDSRSGDYWWNGTMTGYNLKKFLNRNHDYYNWDEPDNTPWFFIRLAEVYLNYAECQIELGNNQEALKYINLIRTRAHMPEATGQDIRKEYEYERTIELLFEGQRFFDLRRWMRMEQTYAPENWPTGMKIYKMKDGSKVYWHFPVPVQQRSFDPSKNYWWPVPRYELNKSSYLDGKPYE